VNSAIKKRILGIPNRYYVLLGIVLIIISSRFVPPVSPHVQLPAEAYSTSPLFNLPGIGPFYWTNTHTAMILIDIILILLALTIRRVASSGALVPNGMAGAVEALLEALHGLTETTAGKWTKMIFPFFLTITFLVLVANWMELIPGVDSIGMIEEVKTGQHGYLKYTVLPGVESIYEVKGAGEELADLQHFQLVPFVRVLSTDLNFTVALALVAVVMTQVMGIRALGIGYFTKFFNVKTIFSRPAFGLIDFLVGLLELVSDFSKILSFSFRLFGNIFAGSVLLFVMGTLLPIIQSGFLLLEFAVGLIQAVIFGMLTMVFMSMATAGHADH
jgi:F-type H+-transporting ATPase subunit a